MIDQPPDGGHVPADPPELGPQMEIRGLPPGQIVHIPIDAFAVDANTHKVFMDASWIVQQQDFEPPTEWYDKVGIMRVHQVEDGALADGFVADFRYINIEVLSKLDITELESKGGMTTVAFHNPQFKTDAMIDAYPLLITAYPAPQDEHDAIIEGDQRFRSHLEAVMDEVDMAAALSRRIPPDNA